MDIIRYSRDIFHNIKKTCTYNLSDDLKLKIHEINEIISNRKDDSSHMNWRIKKSKIFKTDLSDTDILINTLNSLLNKISPLNYEKLSIKILEILNTNNDIKILETVIENIFMKAVMQPIYCPYYVKLCNELININEHVTQIIEEKSNKFKNLVKKTEASYDKKESYDEFCEKIKEKTFKAGYSQFMGELSNSEIIDIRMIYDLLEIFIDNINITIDINSKDPFLEDSIICIYHLMKSTIDKVENNYEDIITKLKIFTKNNNLTKRLKFQILDICDKKFT